MIYIDRFDNIIINVIMITAGNVTEDDDKEEMPEYSCIRDKIMICLGIFVFLCVICLILLFTLPTIYNYNDDIGTNLKNITDIHKNNGTTKPKISGNYNITDSKIYFKGTSTVKFTENTKMNILIVGGGGGASYGGGWITGGSGTGGGGGGCVGEGILIFTANVIYNIIIGNGGKMNRNKISEKGGNTMIKGYDINEMAEGGGYGGYYFYNSIGGGSYGYSGEMTSSGIVYKFNNTYLGKSVQGSGKLTYHSNSGGRGLYNSDKNPGSGGGGAGGSGNAPLSGEYIGGKGGECYVWKINNECYGSGGNGGSLIKQNTTDLLPNTGGGGNGGSTDGQQPSSSGSSGIVILSYI